MTNDEYEALSAEFSALNVQMLLALESGDADLIAAKQAEFAAARRALDVAHLAVNGLEVQPTADPSLQGAAEQAIEAIAAVAAPAVPAADPAPAADTTTPQEG